MRRTSLKFLTFILAMAFFSACSDDDTKDIIEEEMAIKFSDMESEWVRLSLMGQNKIEVMQANTGEIKSSAEGELVKGAGYYTSDTGRYLTSIERDGNRVRFFDSGLMKHDDHGHEYSAKWLDIQIDAPKPTHYTSTGGHIVVFNDGDGSISYINEEQLDMPNYKPEIINVQGTVAHHGAGFRLDNGKFVVSFKDNDEPGGIPQMIKFVEADGSVINDNGGVIVTGIHGDAANGKYGTFGATEGVILADDQGNIDLIKNVDGLNAESGNWLAHVSANDDSPVFFGRSSNLGVFKIDPTSKTIVNIYKGDDVVGDMFSAGGDYLIVHTSDSQLRVYDGRTGDQVTNRKVEMAEIPELAQRKSLSEMEQLRQMEEPSPVILSSASFLYILAPNRTQIQVLEIESLEHVQTIDLASPIDNFAENGFSILGK